SEDFPEPETPVKATIASRGMSTSTLRRLCSPAPRTRTKPSGGSSDISAGQSTVGGNGGPVEAVGRPGGRRYGGEHRLERHGTRPAGPPPPHASPHRRPPGTGRNGRTAGRQDVHAVLDLAHTTTWTGTALRPWVQRTTGPDHEAGPGREAGPDHETGPGCETGPVMEEDVWMQTPGTSATGATNASGRPSRTGGWRGRRAICAPGVPWTWRRGRGATPSGWRAGAGGWTPSISHRSRCAGSKPRPSTTGRPCMPRS